MSLQVWLPLRGDLTNQGLNPVSITNTSAIVNASGKIGKCYQFGTGLSYMDIPKEAMTSFTTEASVCFFIKILTWNKGYATYFQAGVNGVSWAHYIFGLLRNNTASTCCFTISNGSSASNASYLTPTLELNRWYHIALVYKTGHCLIYVDGQLHQDYTTSIVPNFSGITKITLGTGNNRTDGYQTNCQMNDFRIYDHALSAKEVEEISKGLVLHYKLDALNPNMLAADQDLSKWTKESGISVTWDSTVNMYKVTDSTHTSSRWGIYKNIPLKANTTYTFSVMGMKVDQDACLGFGEGTSSYPATAGTFTTTQSRLQKTITIGANDATARIYLHLKPVADGTNYGYFIAPRLIINSSNDDIVYDVSGYQNNGSVINNIEIAYLSPRYESAIVFSNSAAIKVSENNWATQGMLEMTINFWAKPTAAFTKLFSCTESGGFNTESGNSGYLRFPVHVYTNAAQSTTAYKYDGNELQISAIPQNEWTMITLIYTTTGTKTYINGELHHTYNNVSYGIHFNMNARLFLGCEANAASPTSPYYTGQMSDFRIYATALTADQIKELYNTSMAIDSNGNIMAREIQE